MWARYGIMKVSDYSIDIFLVQFQTTEEVNRVIWDGPWNYQGDLLLIER